MARRWSCCCLATSLTAQLSIVTLGELRGASSGLPRSQFWGSPIGEQMVTYLCHSHEASFGLSYGERKS